MYAENDINNLLENNKEIKEDVLNRKKEFGTLQTIWDLRHPARSKWKPKKTESQTLKELSENSKVVFENEINDVKKNVIISIEKELENDNKNRS